MSPASGSRPRELRDAFWQAITDDLNTPRALSIALAAAREPELSPADRWSLMADFDRLLGFSLETATDPETDRDVTEDPRIALRLAERQAAKASRDFATADAIRDELAAIGIKIIDTPAGPRAHRQQPLPTTRSDDEIG